MSEIPVQRVDSPTFARMILPKTSSAAEAVPQPILRRSRTCSATTASPLATFALSPSTALPAPKRTGSSRPDPSQLPHACCRGGVQRD